MTSIPELTRLLAAIHTWQDGHGSREAAPKPPAGSRRRTSCSTRSANMLTELRRAMLGGGNRSQ